MFLRYAAWPLRSASTPISAGASQRRKFGAAAIRRGLRYSLGMNTKLKVIRIGNSAGVILPKEVLARLRVVEGDMLFASEAPDGIRLTASDPDFEAKITLAERIMRQDREILHALAT